MLRFLFALAVSIHGLAHSLFMVNSWGYLKEASGRALFFPKVVGVERSVEGLFALFWLLPLAGFAVTVWEFHHGHAAWRAWLLASATVSSIMLMSWWGGLNHPNAMLAMLFDAAVVALLLLKTPAPATVKS
ncbi:MAG: hypothetical protein U0822_17920 [Anaerolineae bacterium]